MDTKKGPESEGSAPAEERGVGDGVAGDERSGRGGGDAGGSFVPRGAPRRTARTRAPDAARVADFTGEQRLLLLDSWMRSKLPATEFAALVGVTSTTLYGWRKRFEELGPAALLGHRKGQRGSQLPEPTRRAILMMKEAHPDWGQDRIHDMLIRTEGLEASAGAVQRVLLEAGYEVEEAGTRPHPPKAKRFERTRPNELWQTDLFSFLLKRQRRRLHLVAYLDDFSRFLVGFGLHASASGAPVREVFEQAIANFGAPEEVLTDNGAQYHTWRGKSAFAKLCERRGIRQIVASPRRPQTLGKIERFWGTLWRELVEGAVFRDLEEARTRIAHFVGSTAWCRPTATSRRHRR
ncbi:MAG: DDE-type integrase/transposase/recombinase [Planctomycetota bacterium]|jgi:transposase InsO family protein